MSYELKIGNYLLANNKGYRKNEQGLGSFTVLFSDSLNQKINILGYRFI